jgi:hypothetical protein
MFLETWRKWITSKSKITCDGLQGFVSEDCARLNTKMGQAFEKPTQSMNIKTVNDLIKALSNKRPALKETPRFIIQNFVKDAPHY